MTTLRCLSGEPCHTRQGCHCNNCKRFREQTRVGPNHCLHVMHHYDHLAENIECEHPYPAYDWPAEVAAEYDRVFALSVAYGQLAHADFIRSHAGEVEDDEIERYEQTCK